MGGIEKRIGTLEAEVASATPPAEWPLEDQAEALLHTLRLHRIGRSTYQATDREAELLDALIEHGVVSEDARELLARMGPARQPKREQWLRNNWQELKRDRELCQQRLAWHAEHGWNKPTPEELLP